jgi:hypothetical protein
LAGSAGAGVVEGAGVAGAGSVVEGAGVVVDGADSVAAGGFSGEVEVPVRPKI